MSSAPPPPPSPSSGWTRTRVTPAIILHEKHIPPPCPWPVTTLSNDSNDLIQDMLRQTEDIQREAILLRLELARLKKERWQWLHTVNTRPMALPLLRTAKRTTLGGLLFTFFPARCPDHCIMVMLILDYAISIDEDDMTRLCSQFSSLATEA